MAPLLILALTAGAVSDAAEDLEPRLLAPETVEPITAAQFQQLLQHHRGRVILVNLWATWCIPCVKELPELLELQETYRDRGLRVIAVSMDDADRLESKVRPFLAERAPALLSYLQTEDSYTDFVAPLDPDWLGILPTSYLIGRNGELKQTVTGRLSYDAFERALKLLLDEAPDSSIR